MKFIQNPVRFRYSSHMDLYINKPKFFDILFSLNSVMTTTPLMKRRKVPL